MPLKSHLDNLYIYLGAIFILVAIYCENRALTIGFSCGLAVFYLLQSKGKLTRKSFLSIAILLFVMLLVCVFLFKTDSSKGRFFIYKLSFKVLMESFPKGTGLGNFDVAYGNKQIAYFRDCNYSMKEFLLADNIRHAYNDYLEIIIEFGIVGALLIAGWIYTIAFLINRALKQPLQSRIFLPVAVIVVIAISIASLFTFMIYQVHWQLLTIACFATIVYYSQYRHKLFLTIACALVFLSVLAFNFGKRVIYHEDYQKMEEAAQLSKAGYYEEANEIYKEVYPNLKRNNAVTVSYIHSLMDNQEFMEAEKLLQNLLLRDNSSLNYELLAHCYEKQHKVKLAETMYLKSIYKVPNRFGSRFKLFLLYLNTNQTMKARSTGIEILKMPVKIPSKVIEYFKLTVKNELNKAGHFNESH